VGSRMSKEIKKWTLTRKNNKSWPLPMSKYRGSHGNIRRICVSFDWDSAVTFKDKQDALWYLTNYSEKYPICIPKWKPIKVKALVKKQKMF